MKIEDAVVPQSEIQLLSEEEDLELSLRKYDKIVVNIVVSVCRGTHVILVKVPTMLTKVLRQVLLLLHVVRRVVVSPVIRDVSLEDPGVQEAVVLVVGVEVGLDAQVGGIVVRAIRNITMIKYLTVLTIMLKIWWSLLSVSTKVKYSE